MSRSPFCPRSGRRNPTRGFHFCSNSSLLLAYNSLLRLLFFPSSNVVPVFPVLLRKSNYAQIDWISASDYELGLEGGIPEVIMEDFAAAEQVRRVQGRESVWGDRLTPTERTHFVPFLPQHGRTGARRQDMEALTQRMRNVQDYRRRLIFSGSYAVLSNHDRATPVVVFDKTRRVALPWEQFVGEFSRHLAEEFGSVQFYVGTGRDRDPSRPVALDLTYSCTSTVTALRHADAGDGTTLKLGGELLVQVEHNSAHGSGAITASMAFVEVNNVRVVGRTVGVLQSMLGGQNAFGADRIPSPSNIINPNPMITKTVTIQNVRPFYWHQQVARGNLYSLANCFNAVSPAGAYHAGLEMRSVPFGQLNNPNEERDQSASYLHALGVYTNALEEQKMGLFRLTSSPEQQQRRNSFEHFGKRARDFSDYPLLWAPMALPMGTIDRNEVCTWNCVSARKARPQAVRYTYDDQQERMPWRTTASQLFKSAGRGYYNAQHVVGEMGTVLSNGPANTDAIFNLRDQIFAEYDFSVKNVLQMSEPKVSSSAYAEMFKKSIYFGYTFLSKAELHHLLDIVNASELWSGYNLLQKNCCHFVAFMAEQVLGTEYGLPYRHYLLGECGNYVLPYCCAGQGFEKTHSRRARSTCC
ncbi:unnamed protein product [Amoebophrya sp. A120]|nr:unnamed protein product [Amoebophrya sp. A120]|eukprot:GSA120T00020180001.1